MIFLPRSKGFQMSLDELAKSEIIEEQKTRGIILDEFPADNGSMKTQDEWMYLFDKPNQAMARMSDIYYYIKFLKRKYDDGSTIDKNIIKKYVESLRNDMDSAHNNNWLMTRTRIAYDSDNEMHKYTMMDHCRIGGEIGDVFSGQGNISVHRKTPILAVANDSNDGLIYLKHLFGHDDDAKTIVETLEFLAGNSVPVCIYVGHQTTFELNIAGFQYTCNEELSILGTKDLLNPGRARGVRIVKRNT